MYSAVRCSRGPTQNIFSTAGYLGGESAAPVFLVSDHLFKLPVLTLPEVYGLCRHNPPRDKGICWAIFKKRRKSPISVHGVVYNIRRLLIWRGLLVLILPMQMRGCTSTNGNVGTLGRCSFQRLSYVTFLGLDVACRLFLCNKGLEGPNWVNQGLLDFISETQWKA